MRLRNDDIKFLFENVPVGTRVQFINEPVKVTSEPDGSRYIEVHNPLSTSEDQINNNAKSPITLTSAVQSVTFSRTWKRLSLTRLCRTVPVCRCV